MESLKIVWNKRAVRRNREIATWYKNQMGFVIQPFSEKYDERYEDIYKPAIENGTGIEAYKVIRI